MIIRYAQSAGMRMLDPYAAEDVPILVRGERRYLPWGGYIRRAVARNIPGARSVRIHAAAYTHKLQLYEWVDLGPGEVLLGRAIPYSGRAQWLVFAVVEEGDR